MAGTVIELSSPINGETHVRFDFLYWQSPVNGPLRIRATLGSMVDNEFDPAPGTEEYVADGIDASQFLSAGQLDLNALAADVLDRAKMADTWERV